MKILIVSFYYPPEMGAAPSRICNMAEAMTQQGIEVNVLTCLPNYPKGKIFEGYRKRLYKQETIQGVRIFRYWTYATISKNAIARLMGMLVFALAIWLFGLRISKNKSYDKIIIQTPPLLVGFSAILLYRCIYRKQTILNVSDLWPLSAVELGAVKQGGTYYKILAWMERFVYKKANAFFGQSDEILQHIQSFGYNKPRFLYRNLQPQNIHKHSSFLGDREKLKLAYAGLLGVAQDILGIIQHINFKELGAELHIYGGGNQAEAIQEYVAKNDCGVICHGYKKKEEINQILGTFHASIVPLAVSIKGAVPSKIFDLLPHGTPIIFCGGGEGKNIILQYNLGVVSQPGDYEALKENIIRLKNMTDVEYSQMRECCLQASANEFSFERQTKCCLKFLNEL